MRSPLVLIIPADKVQSLSRLMYMEENRLNIVVPEDYELDKYHQDKDTIQCIKDEIEKWRIADKYHQLADIAIRKDSKSQEESNE